MALKIRLSRGGAKKRPFYRIVVADSRSPRDGRFIERLGTYNPMIAKDKDDRVILKEDRIKYWLSQGAKPSDRVARFLGKVDIISLPERFEQTKQHLPRAKTLERLKEAEEAEKAEKAEKTATAANSEEAPAADENSTEDDPSGESSAVTESDPVAEEAAEKTVEEVPTADEDSAENASSEETSAAVEEDAVAEAVTDSTADEDSAEKDET